MFSSIIHYSKREVRTISNYRKGVEKIEKHGLASFVHIIFNNDQFLE